MPEFTRSGGAPAKDWRITAYGGNTPRSIPVMPTRGSRLSVCVVSSNHTLRSGRSGRAPTQGRSNRILVVDDDICICRHRCGGGGVKFLSKNRIVNRLYAGLDSVDVAKSPTKSLFFRTDDQRQNVSCLRVRGGHCRRRGRRFMRAATTFWSPITTC